LRDLSQTTESSGLILSQSGYLQRAPCIEKLPYRFQQRVRNKHLQTILVEAAKLAPRWSTELALVYERENRKEIATGPHWPWRANWWLT
jgi:hypothetical protein